MNRICWHGLTVCCLLVASFFPARADSTGSERPVPLDHYGDPLPWGASARLGSSRFRPGNEIVALAFAPDGRTLAGTVEDKLTVLWDVATGRQLRALPREGSNKNFALAYSPDGKILAFCSSSYSVRLCDAVTGKTLQELRWQKGDKKEEILALAFSPDGRFLALACEFGIRLWHVASGRDVRRFSGKDDPHDVLAFTPDSKLLAAGYRLLSDDPRQGQIQLWDVTTGKRVRSLAAPRDIWSIALSRDGKYLAAGSDGPIAQIWNLASGQVLHELGDGEGRGRCVAFAPDSRTLAVAGFDRPVGGADGFVRLWDVATGRELRKLGGPQGDVWALAYSPDGRFVATGGRDNQVRLFDPRTGQERILESGHVGPVGVVALSPNGRLAVTGDEEAIHFWDPLTGNKLHGIAGAQGEGAQAASFSWDGKRLATAHTSGRVNLWDVQTKRAISHPPDPGKGSWWCGCLPNGTILAVGNTPNGLHVWDVASGKTLGQLTFAHAQVYPVALAAAQQRIAYEGENAEVWLWNRRRHHSRLLIDREGLVTFPGGFFFDSVYALAFSDDGKTLLSRTRNKGVCLWEVASGKERLVVNPSVDDVWSVTLAPDGLTIASGGWDGSVRFWDAVTGKQLFYSSGHRGTVSHLTFSADGGLMASASYDGTALIWNVKRLTPTRQPSPHVLTPKEINTLWGDLASSDARKAYLAIVALRTGGPQVASELAQRLKPVQSPYRDEQIVRLVQDLESDRLAIRQAAAHALARVGSWAEVVLRKRLEERPSLECRQRLEALLEKLEQAESSAPALEVLRALRAIEVLEWLRTPEAGQCLLKLSAGAPSARLTGEAKAALDRQALLRMKEKAN